MRQLRVKSTSCQVHNEVTSECEYDYNLFNEEKQSYQPGWGNETEVTYSSSISEAFEYQSSEDLDTYVLVGDHGTYGGDGYVYEFLGRLSDLQSNLSQLHQLGWIDTQTRAVIIQLNLYNPNVQLFTSVTFLSEFLSTGGVDPSSRFEPMNFNGNLHIFSFFFD
jgi:polycystin 1L2